MKIAGESDADRQTRELRSHRRRRRYRQALEKLLDAKRSVADDYPQLLPWLIENDGVAVATSHGIKLASQAMQKRIEANAGDVRSHGRGSGFGLADDGVRLEMYAKFLQWAEKDVDVIAARARVDKEDTVHVATRTRFAKDSVFAATLAKIQPSEKSPLAGMPGGQFVVAGGGVWSDSLTQSIVDFQSGVMKQSFRMAYDLDEKKAEDLVKNVLDMPKGVRSMSMMIGPGQPGEPLLSDMLALYGVEDAKKYLDEYEKYLCRRWTSRQGRQGGEREEALRRSRRRKSADAQPWKPKWRSRCPQRSRKRPALKR